MMSWRIACRSWLRAPPSQILRRLEQIVGRAVLQLDQFRSCVMYPTASRIAQAKQHIGAANADVSTRQDHASR